MIKIWEIKIRNIFNSSIYIYIIKIKIFKIVNNTKTEFIENNLFYNLI